MTSSRMIPVVLALVLAAAPAARSAGEQVTFELPDMDGVTRTRSDFEARYVLFVYQGMP